MEKMTATYSKSTINLGRSGKGLITSLVLDAKARPKRYKKTRYAIVNVSKKDLSMVIREFDKLSYNNYEKRRPKHEPTDS